MVVEVVLAVVAVSPAAAGQVVVVVFLAVAPQGVGR